jgi:hypothetical protein
LSTEPDAAGATFAISGALITIGNDPDSVAETMRAMGCCGVANDPTDNPVTDLVARYGIRGAEVAWNGKGYVCRATGYEQDVSVPLPDPVAMFMEQFNSGLWPEFDVSK